MSPDDFLKKARDPSAWKDKAMSLRRSADAVWDAFSEKLLQSVTGTPPAIDEGKLNDASNVLRNSQFLYSLAAECALKGLIIKKHPSDVIFETTVDGTGSVIDAKIKQIGRTRIDTHNLEKLAEVAGALRFGNDPEIREVLAYSTFCIHWLGRYPVPLDTSADFVPRGKVPRVVFNHYYRDVMDPFLDSIFAKLES